MKKKAVKRRLKGIVVSAKMEKTAVVKVDRLKFHSKYKKYYKVSKKFKAHNEANKYKEGEKVIIEETRPLSKEKRWRIVGYA
ncbi:MAG: 30S ribosomal protein S17 [Minisyncoccia bacterium]